MGGGAIWATTRPLESTMGRGFLEIESDFAG